MHLVTTRFSSDLLRRFRRFLVAGLIAVALCGTAAAWSGCGFFLARDISASGCGDASGVAFPLCWLGLSAAVGWSASRRGRSGFGWGVLSVVGSPVLGYWALRAFGTPMRKEKAPEAWDEAHARRAVEEESARWLASLGPDHAARTGAIEALFAERTATIKVTHFVQSTTLVQLSGEPMATEEERRKGIYYQAGKHWMKKEIRSLYFDMSRNLAAMDTRERELLRVAELLNSAAGGAEERYRGFRAALVCADGKGVPGQAWWVGLPGDSAGDIIARNHAVLGLSVAVNMSAMLHHLEELRGGAGGSPALRAIAADALDRLNTGGGGGFLRPGEIGGTIFRAGGAHALRIGAFGDGTPLEYAGEGSMVTIAPPGSGKTQCNVLPTLLTWDGPAVVLDISGDLYDGTSRWRAENVGPVYKFSPLEPGGSHSYNPLSFVRSDPDFVWEDSRMLAEALIVPSASAADPFWENEARTVVTAAIAHLCYAEPPEQRPMHRVVDALFGGEVWTELLDGLRGAVDVRVMTQHANALASMPEKTLASVLQTARSSMSAWQGTRLQRVTARSDWSPLDLRSDRKPTIYIVLRPNEVEAYLSVLRVFIGQHIRMLIGGKPPGAGGRPILFMLDELPRLRHMPPVEEALEIGRKYNLRLWMFAQSLGQLQTAYKNADGMMGSCAVRIFMNPSGADGLAEKLSEELGYVDSLADGSRRRLVEAAELAGPKFGDQQLVLALKTKPIRVAKCFAFQDPVLKERMGSRDDVEVADGR